MRFRLPVHCGVEVCAAERSGVFTYSGDTDTHKARAEPARKSGAFQQPDGPWRLRGSGLANAPADLFPNEILQPLRDARGECAAPSYFREIGGAHLACSKRFHQNVGRSDSVLDGQIDPDTGHWRHGVRRVADAHEARAI